MLLLLFVFSWVWFQCTQEVLRTRISTFLSRISRKQTAGSSCKKQIKKLKPSENTVFKEVYKILKYETLGQVILCCAQENFLQKWENIEHVGGVYISIIIKIITRSAEDFLPATSPSVLSVGSTTTFKLLHYPKQMTSDKACQTVMVTQSSPWGQNSSGNLNLSLEDGWIMASSSNRRTKEKKKSQIARWFWKTFHLWKGQRSYVFSQPNNMFHQQVLDCQMHEPLQLAEYPDEINLSIALDL